MRTLERIDLETGSRKENVDGTTSAYSCAMSLLELHKEYTYRVSERLGVLCGSDDPTPEQLSIAQFEADQWLTETTQQKPAGQLKMEL